MADHCDAHETYEPACDECRAARRQQKLRWHDAHQTLCPGCNSLLIFTDSPSMLQEAQAAGIPQAVTLVKSIHAMFQGERTKIFPVPCKCGRSFMAFVDVVNREEVFERRQNLESMKMYNPRAFSAQYEGESDADVLQRLAPEKRRMVLISKEEFAQRVLSERNHMVREGLMRKCEEAGLGIPWTGRPQRVARLVLEPGDLTAGTARGP